MVLASVRVCKIWKNCKLDLAAATGRNCLIWGKEAVLGDADENKKLTGNKQRANRKSPVPLLPPGFYSPFGAPYWQSRTQPVGKEEVRFAVSQSPRFTRE